MPQNRFERRGAETFKWHPEPVPAELDSHPFPKAIKDKLAASDEAYLKLDTAAMVWEDAHARLTHQAALADKDLLIAALRAGEPDPGTPNQDAADRAEEVAWTALGIAYEDAREPMRAGIEAIKSYLTEHPETFAKHELEMMDKAEASRQALIQAEIQCENDRRAVGVRYVIARQYAGERFAPEPWMLAQYSGTHGNNHANEVLREKYEAMANGDDWQPPVQPGPLGTFDEPKRGRRAQV